MSLIEKYAVGKSFADIGCMWGVNGSYAFLAEESGASRVVAVDIYPASEVFVSEANKRKSAVEFIQGDIHHRDLQSKIGVCDTVFCSGVLYHSPNPLDLLHKLRLICGEVLILGTQLIPEMRGIRNTAVFYPFLDEKQRKIWNQGIGRQKSITGPYESESGYGNWFWGFSPSCVESMLACAGFTIEERYKSGFIGYFVCRTGPVQFVPISGDWTTPSDENYLKFKRL
ncbi:MAG: methyltransferase domain-containing protein [Nitrospirae bacterium]|nr:methyltransferase domain-containing protein [Nitrospirota bacterium]